jgi:WD40 repeat protein/serine/threonine protein kinase
MPPTSDHSADRTPSCAEDAFSRYLRLCDEGQDVDFEQYCREFPQFADELLDLAADWQRMAGVVDGLGDGFDDEPREDNDPNGQPSQGHDHGRGRQSPSELSATFELDVDGRGTTAPGASGISHIIERLSADVSNRRYSPRGEIARGGMGVIQRMWDSDLRRNLAMKVMLERRQRKGGIRGSATESRHIGRFLEEAQITGQLDHPGIVPVHELGLNEAGQLYFTMRLVRGRDLRAIFELVHDEREGWTVARALGVIQRVCEAMAYAHSKRVIHRDIKPSNIMVGRFGEVYVMDWGLAKVTGRKDMHDLRPDLEGAEGAGHVHPDIPEDGEPHRSPLQTMDGTVVGTPSYMSPEQAQGKDNLIGPQSDIYSVGALLYQLLSGQMPYVNEGKQVSPFALPSAVRKGPPRSILQINRRVPPALVAICEKAMARDTGDRYPSMKDMADELRAFIEGRVVRTYETGALAEARKWVVRNKGSAAILGIAFLALTVLVTNLFQTNDSLRKSNLAKTLSEQEAKEAQARLQDRTEQLEVAVDEARRESRRADDEALEARYRGYVTSIAATDGALRFHELTEAKSSLREAPSNLRDWEWNHLLLKADPSLATLEGHAAPVNSVVFGPKGKLLATASADGTVNIWDTASRSRLNKLDHQNDAVTSVAIHPNGRTLACAGSDGKVSLWDAVSGNKLGDLWQDHEGASARDAVTALVFSPNGKRLFASTAGRRVCSWNVDNAEFRVFPGRHDLFIGSLAISSDGTRLASASADRTAAIWDATTGEQRQLLFDHTDSVLAVAFHPLEGSPYVATASADGLARLFDSTDGALLVTYEGHMGPVNSVSFSPDGSEILTGSDDGTLRRWATFSGEELSGLSGHEDAVTSATFSPDGLLMASGSADTKVKLWDRAYEDGSTTMRGHTDVVHSLDVSPDGLRVVSSAWNARVHLWDADTLLSLTALDLPLGGAAMVAFRPDGKQIAAGMISSDRDEPNPIYFLDASSHDMLTDLPIVASGHSSRITALAYSLDGRLVASASYDGKVCLWNSETGALVQTLQGHNGRVHCLAFQPGGNLLASGGYDETVRIWDHRSGEQLQEFRDQEGAVNSLAWAPDGGGLASAHGPLVCFRELGRQGSTHIMRGHQDDVTGLSFHPNGQRLASSSLDGTIRLWDQNRATHLLTLRAGQPCSAIAFDSGGGRLYAALDTSIKVFETSPPVVTFNLRHDRMLAADEARKLFQARLDRHVAPSAVIESLQQDEFLDPIVRAEALRLARNFGTHPLRLAQTAWVIIRSPNTSRSAYLEAFRLVRAADTMSPGQPLILSILGAAHYRMGDNASAISALQQAHALHAADEERPMSWNLLFLAMASWQRGNSDLAESFLRQARESSRSDNRHETRALLREASDLIERQGG